MTLQWTFIICSAAEHSLETPSLFLPPPLSSSILLPFSSYFLFSPSLFFPVVLFYYLPSSLSFFSLFLLPSLFLSSFLPLYLPLPLSSSIRFPFSLSIPLSIYSASLLFSLIRAFSLNPVCHDTYYFSIF